MNSLSHSPLDKTVWNKGHGEHLTWFMNARNKNMNDTCARMISPGGTLPGRGAAAGRANRGINVTYVQQMNLRRCCFLVNCLWRIQRPHASVAVNLIMLKEPWEERFDLENPGKDAEKVEVKDPAPLTKVEDVKNTIETLEFVLLRRLGAGGSPLACIARPVVELPENTPGEVDPGFGLPSRVEELIRRTRHDGPNYT